jgi:hypothetical protein
MQELLRIVVGVENGQLVVSVGQSSALPAASRGPGGQITIPLAASGGSVPSGPPAAGNVLVNGDLDQARTLLAECGVKSPNRWLTQHPAWQIIDVCQDCIDRGTAVRNRASYVVTVLLRGGTPGR